LVAVFGLWSLDLGQNGNKVGAWVKVLDRIGTNSG
jgi:hypothetical protein